VAARTAEALIAERSRPDAIRDRADSLQTELTAEQAAHEKAREMIERFQQEVDARRALGRLARLRAAWRGE
jgi:hypothetical protein